MNWILIRSVCTALNQVMAAALLSVALVSPARACFDHTSLVWSLLSSKLELIHQSVATEPLAAFLAAGQAGITEILEAVESWSVTTIERNVPSRFVSDSDFEWTRSDFEQSIAQWVAHEQGEPAIAELDAAVIVQLALLGGRPPLDYPWPGSGPPLAGEKLMTVVPLLRALEPANV